MYKAIFIDIDGTLRNNKRELSKRTIEAIKKVTEKGILVVLCSGRPIKYTEDLSRQCYASNYIITCNGGCIYDYEKNETLYSSIIDKDSIIKLYNIAQNIDVRLLMYTLDNIVVTKLKYLDGREEMLTKNIEDFVKDNDIIQCVIVDTDFYKIKSIKEEIENIKNVEIKNQHKSLIDENFSKQGNIYYDVASIESNKGEAVKEFCNILNIDLKDVIAIGDGINDIPMFKIIGHSVAMENASDEVKEYANEITLSNEQDGVAIFLENLIK